jgi:hypothetical protein
VRLGDRAARCTKKLPVLVVVCSAMLALGAQTSAADPVSGVLGAVSATATQQLDAVAHDATTAVPLPANPPAAVSQVSADAAQSVAAVPQAVAGAEDAVRSSVGGSAESTRSSDPGESGAHDESSGRRGASSPPLIIAAATERVGRAVASPPPAPGERAAIAPATRRIISSRIERVAETLTDTARHAPVTRALAAHASRIAGALLSAVADLAANARDTLTVLPVPVVASLSQASLTPNPLSAGAGAFAAQPSIDRPALAASIGAAVSTQAALSSVDPFVVPLLQRSATRQQQVPPAAHGGVGEASRASSRVTSWAVAHAASYARTSVAASRAQGEAVPAPSPGGFSPASSASVAGGLSAATSLALVALLLLAAPRALRRLRPAPASRRLTQFALIPARPG